VRLTPRIDIVGVVRQKQGWMLNLLISQRGVFLVDVGDIECPLIFL